eukprot:scaffold2923_cov112-Isochrysis_galbana.AAC.1
MVAVPAAGVGQVQVQRLRQGRARTTAWQAKVVGVRRAAGRTGIGDTGGGLGGKGGAGTGLIPALRARGPCPFPRRPT